MSGPSSRVPRPPRHETGIPTIGRSRGTGRRTRPRISSLTVTVPYAKTARESTIPPLVKEPVELERFGPYVVHERLGEGGMATVHRAEHLGVEGFAKQVALKRMLTHLTADSDFVSSFVHEAQIVSRLRHPNIAQAYDLGRIGNTYYIAMELVPGPTLAQVIRRARAVHRTVPVEIAVEILIQLCDALEHAHELRDDAGKTLHLIHRDISPGNVILSTSGVVKLIDFGICKDRSRRAATDAGVIKGKHAYVAPEYTYGSLDRRCDLFGLGVLAHEVLTGQRLFLGETEVQTLRNVREMDIAPPSRKNPRVDADLDAIVLTALARDPSRRWQTAGAMRAALEHHARSTKLAASPRHIRDFVASLFSTSRPDSLSEYTFDLVTVSAELASAELASAELASADLASGSDPSIELIVDPPDLTPVPRPTHTPSDFAPTVPRAAPIGSHIAARARRRASTHPTHGLHAPLILLVLFVLAALITMAAARIGLFDAAATLAWMRDLF
ncbi:MAG: serine/threonine protein kinase [Deltaproteobacteria bacterium]|nr:serine/threonine protein kinase [Deltaproteobacteria bacterium]MCW5805857.1 serine/threonine protein kinase [Deltaproteobacteria bacterium]